MRLLWELANPQLEKLSVYEPGKPIEETARELDVDPASIVKLASNENPLGPSFAAVKAMRSALEEAQLYPDGSGFYLRKALAKHLNIPENNFILGNGSNEIVELLAHAFLRPGDNIVTSQYAFIAYKIAATLLGAETIEVPSPDFRFHLDTILEAVTPRTRLIFIANPNNPTGTLVSQHDIDGFIARVPDNIVIVFDEAYHEFLDHPPDVIRYLQHQPNVAVIRTFSKIHGLAGLRVGYGIAAEQLIEVLQKTREPFNVNSIAQAGAIAALSDRHHQRLTKETVDSGREVLVGEFRTMGVEFVPGVANFLMVNVGDGPRVFQEMLARKVIIRPLAGYGLRAWVRISVGTREQNEKCISALKEILSRNTNA